MGRIRRNIRPGLAKQPIGGWSKVPENHGYGWRFGSRKATSWGGHSAGPVPLLNCVRIRICIRVKQHSPQTEQPYLDWIERFIHFHGKRHPPEVRAHLQPLNPIFRVFSDSSG